MTAALGLRTGVKLWLVPLELALMLLAASRSFADDAPAAQPAKPARPAEALGGELVRKREPKFQTDASDLLGKIDLTKDVFYTIDDNPVPEDQQFQFVEGRLQTPEKGDARLRLPVELPKFYKLSLQLLSKHDSPASSVGIVAATDGNPFSVSLQAKGHVLGRFYGQDIRLRPTNRNIPLGKPELQRITELLVGDGGIVVRHRSGLSEWAAPPAAFSLDEKWNAGEPNKIFLSFSEGQFELQSITLEPLSRDEWLKAVAPGAIATAAETENSQIELQATPFPTKSNALRPTIVMHALRGNFDELEGWADRLRKEEIVVNEHFVAEDFYNWLSRAYLDPLPPGSSESDGLYQAELAFTDGWLKHSPDSVAARIVKARVYDRHAWHARGGGFAEKVPQEAWKPFKERLEAAELLLREAARLKPRDVCVFSSMLGVGVGLEWTQAQMEKVVERGLQVSKKDPVLIDVMVNRLLPRWGGEPGDLGKFALQISERIKGDDGLDAFARVARYTQAAEVELVRSYRMRGKTLQVDRDFTDPAVVLAEFSAEKMRAAVPVVRKRYPKANRALNHACWMCCVVEDQDSAKELFAEIVNMPDLDIWGSRDSFDRWRRWADPAVPEPSQFLPTEGEELTHIQAYSIGGVSLAYLLDDRTLVTGSLAPASTIKLWNVERKEISKQLEPWPRMGRPTHLKVLDNGKLIAFMGYGNQVKPLGYEAPNDDQRFVYPATVALMNYNRISDDGQTGVFWENETITVGEARQHKRTVIKTLQLEGVNISPNGKYLWGRGEKSLFLWDATTGEQITELDTKTNLTFFLRDSSAVAFATTDKLTVWDLATKRERFSAQLGPGERIERFRSTSDGRFLACGQSRPAAGGQPERHVIAIYDLQAVEPIHVFDGHKTPIVDLAISRDGARLASSTGDGVVKVWDLAAATRASQP